MINIWTGGRPVLVGRSVRGHTVARTDGPRWAEAMGRQTSRVKRRWLQTDRQGATRVHFETQTGSVYRVMEDHDE